MIYCKWPVGQAIPTHNDREPFSDLIEHLFSLLHLPRYKSSISYLITEHLHLGVHHVREVLVESVVGLPLHGGLDVLLELQPGLGHVVLVLLLALAFIWRTGQQSAAVGHSGIAAGPAQGETAVAAHVGIREVALQGGVRHAVAVGLVQRFRFLLLVVEAFDARPKVQC